jgi:energy-coupling factor transporter ATP-binding protein EcfA2
VIKIESIHVEETRGIRDLDLELGRANFVVTGPNGSGKSGVVDAIQFVLTGEIGRLQGEGSADLSLKEHGPHVDSRDYPDASFVRLEAFIPSLGKQATIKRWIGKPHQPEITPDEPGVTAVFRRLEDHRELTLARREIIKFILTEAAERSHQVQALLKLDSINDTRAALKTAENKLNSELAVSKAEVAADAESLLGHLGLSKLSIQALLEAANERRRVLGLKPLEELRKETKLTDGLSEGGGKEGVAQTRESALRDLRELLDLMTSGAETPTAVAAASALASIQAIEADSELLSTMRRQPLLNLGLDLLDGPHCPLCDTGWEIEELRAHLQGKLAKSQTAQAVSDGLLKFGAIISKEVARARSLVELAARISEVGKGTVQRFGEWRGDLASFSAALSTLDGILSTKGRLESGWLAPPLELKGELETLFNEVAIRPDRSAMGQARDFLVVAQERLTKLQGSERSAAEKTAGAARGSITYKTYCQVAEEALAGLYASVEDDFAAYYQLINYDDEGEFKAKLLPSEGKLGLLVDFYKKGMFPPGAFHSEGHQDGMGVCLYLALVKQVLGPDFTFAVLDDVVMSVDHQHRRQFCKLLKTHFPDTQFLITTHDNVWAQQMRSEGLIGKKNSVAFSSWTVETGPIVGEVEEVWDRISEDLAKNEIPTAAGRLRRHLEYVSAEVADQLGASVPFRGDGSYDMGDLLSGVIGRQGELLKRANKAANSWGNAENKAEVEKLLNLRKEILAAVDGEQWAINKAIHFNEWADLSKEDFQPVVDVFKGLLEQFRCAKCNSWVAISPRKQPADLRCDCGAFRLNLKEKTQ